MTKTEKKQIHILKTVLESNKKITVFKYAKENKLDRGSTLVTAEHLAKIGALEISSKRITGDGNKLIWANLQTERVIENPKLLNGDSNIIIETYKDSIVIKGDNSGNQSSFSNKSLNVNPPKKPTKNTKQKIISFIINFLKWLIPLSISIGILYYAMKK